MPRITSICVWSLTFLTFGSADVHAQWFNSAGSVDAPAVSGTGTGVVRVNPDQAVLFLTISPLSTAGGAEGLAEVGAVRDQIQSSLMEAGVDSADLSPWGLTASPEPVMGNMGQMGTPVSFGLRAVVRDLAQVNAVAETALLHGARSITATLLETVDESTARQQAAARALGNAREEAQAAASAAGGSLGRLISITTSPDYSSIGNGFMTSFGRGGEMLPQDPSVRVTVQATWEFLPG